MLFLTGPTQSGKTTLSQRIAKEAKMRVFGTGQFFRSLTDSKMSERDRESIASTDRSEDFEQAIRSKIRALSFERERCVVEGFPRGVDQIQFLSSLTQELRFFQPTVVFLHLSWEECLRRWEGRKRNESREFAKNRFDSFNARMQEMENECKNLKIPYSVVFVDEIGPLENFSIDSLLK